jgi:cytoskeletal protein CcmA (bactofilin family)
MASNVSIIGRTTRVRGRVTGAVDLEVQGYVEGEIAVGGDVTVDTQGIVGAGIQGRRLVVRGAVKGDLVGEESIVLEQGARVVGDVRAPRVAVRPGALLRGYVQTGDHGAVGAKASRAQAAARPAPVHAPAAVPKPIAVVAPPKVMAKPVPAPVSAAARPAAANATNARRPPPPVVPALRGAKGQIAKKKER